MAMPRTLEVISDNFKIVRPAALGPTQPPTRCGKCSMRPKREAKYSPSPNAEVKNVQSYNFVRPHVKTWCMARHRQKPICISRHTRHVEDRKRAATFIARCHSILMWTQDDTRQPEHCQHTCDKMIHDLSTTKITASFRLHLMLIPSAPGPPSNTHPQLQKPFNAPLSIIWWWLCWYSLHHRNYIL
jgi:hypothetical protein